MTTRGGAKAGVLHVLRRRAGEAVGRAFIAFPPAIRSELARDLARRELARPGPPSRVSRLFASSNDAAAEVALRFAADGSDTPLSADALQRRVAQGSSNSLLTAALAYARLRGLDVPAAEWIARVRAANLDPGTLRQLVAEIRQLDDPARPGLLADLRSGLDEPGRHVFDAMTSAWDLIDQGSVEDAVQWAADDDAVAVAVAHRAQELHYEPLLELAQVVERREALDPEATLTVASALRDAGDFTTSTRLARQALSARPTSVTARSLVDNGQSALSSIRDGWSPPAPEQTEKPPATTGTIPYLLHSALPQVSMGYATRSHGLLVALRAAGWDVEGVTRPGFPLDDPSVADAPATDVVDGVPYRHVLYEARRPMPLLPVGRGAVGFSQAVRDLYTDVDVPLVHAASSFRNGLAGVHAARRLGVPSVYEVRGLWEFSRLAREPWFDSTDSFRLMSTMETAAATEADRVIVITQALADLLVRRGVDAAKISVVPNGVDTSRFAPRARDEELARELGVAARTVIGYVGSLLDYEGLDLLVDAAARLRRRRDDFAVLVVGDGRGRPALEAQVEELGLEDTVIFTGRVPHEDVERYYSLVDVAPFPRAAVAVTELVSPLKPFEAMAMGKLVVASDVAALGEIVQDGRTGRLFPKGDAGALATVLGELLDDRTAATGMAQQGLAWVRSERDWRTVATGISAVYESLGVAKS